MRQVDNRGMSEHALHPYESLTPDCVLDALDSIGLRGDGRLTALGSYENRVYQVFLDDAFDGHAQVVAKFYRPNRWTDAQIDEEHAFAAELVAAEVPVVAPLMVHGKTLHHWNGFAFSVSPRRGGRLPELEDTDVLEWTGRYLARLHTVGARSPFKHRPALTLDTLGWEPRTWLLTHQQLPHEVENRWADVTQRALDCAQTTLTASTRSSWAAHDAPNPIMQLRLHGDCHPGNILWTPIDAATHLGPGPHFVDLDDARTGPAIQDLWMLLSGERADQTRQLGAVLDGYEGIRPFDRRELAWIEPLRTVRMLHYSAWLASRWSDPAFGRAFPWFGTVDYWQGQIHAMEDQIEAMASPPLIA
jgi:Ser/Thr protein kinase RdoA (MazF antagonist)